MLPELPPHLAVLHERVRDYIQTRVRPHAAQREELAEPLARFPWDWIEELSRMGVRTLTLPEEDGGMGAGILACCVFAEEIGAGDLGLAVALDQTWKFIPLIARGTPAVRARFLDPLRQDARFLIGGGSSEPSSGSDQSLPFNKPGAGARATAERIDGDWFLSGEKAPISNGGVAKLYVLTARTVPGTGGAEGLTAFFVSDDAPGFSVAEVYDKGGQRMNSSAMLRLEKCRIPHGLVLGEPGQAGAAMGRILGSRGFPQAAACVLGVARAAFEDALAFARGRIQGGAPVIEHPNVAILLAEMNASIESARALIYRAAWECERNGPDAARLAVLSKVVAAEAAFKVATHAMRVCGRWATLKGGPTLDKYLRDAASFLHSDGQNEVLLIKAARML
jgi:alkylation response protein AidB-like acyl-CoA dehydrogenase